MSIPINGTLSGNLTTFPNKITFTCDEGFILQGSAIRQCQADKQWTGNATVCDGKDSYCLLTLVNMCQLQIISYSYLSFAAVDCGRLAAPKNGSSSGNLTVFPNSVHFKCDEGFILSGSSIRICQANGTWSGLKTWCSGKISLPSPNRLFYAHSLGTTNKIFAALLLSYARLNGKGIGQSLL